jgi:hypothetical protein
MGLQSAARGHVCKLRIYHKIILQFRRLYIPLIVLLARAAREQLTIKAVALCQKILEAPGLELIVLPFRYKYSPWRSLIECHQSLFFPQ